MASKVTPKKGSATAAVAVTSRDQVESFDAIVRLRISAPRGRLFQPIVDGISG